jgi:F0F1-type ATP synthase membrane subunit a
MEKLEHPLWIVDFVNTILGPPVRSIGEAMGYHFTGHQVVPNYLVMILLIVAGLTVLSLIVRSRLSVENPGKLQIVLEDGVGAVRGLLGSGSARRVRSSCRSSPRLAYSSWSVTTWA